MKIRVFECSSVSQAIRLGRVLEDYCRDVRVVGHTVFGVECSGEIPEALLEGVKGRDVLTPRETHSFITFLSAVNGWVGKYLTLEEAVRYVVCCAERDRRDPELRAFREAFAWVTCGSVRDYGACRDVVKGLKLWLRRVLSPNWSVLPKISEYVRLSVGDQG